MEVRVVKNAKFYYNHIYGDIDKNTQFGIYGTYTGKYDETSLIEVADPIEVQGRSSGYIYGT